MNNPLAVVVALGTCLIVTAVIVRVCLTVTDALVDFILGD